MRAWRASRQLAILQPCHSAWRNGSEAEATITRTTYHSTSSPPSTSTSTSTTSTSTSISTSTCTATPYFPHQHTSPSTSSQDIPLQHDWGGRRHFTRGSAPATCSTAALFLRRRDELVPGDGSSLSDRSSLHLSFTSSSPSEVGQHPTASLGGKPGRKEQRHSKWRVRERVTISRPLNGAVSNEWDAKERASTSGGEREEEAESRSEGVRRELSSRARGGLEPLLAFIEGQHWEFDASNASHALAILNAKSRRGAGVGRGGMARRQHRVLELLAACLESCIEDGEGPGLCARDISNALHALVKLGHREKPWALLEAAASRAEDFNALDTFQLLWAMGRARMRERRVLGVFEARCVALLPKLEPFQVANLLWVYTVLEHPAPRFFTAALPLLRPSQLHDGSLLSVLWAVAAAEGLPSAAPISTLFDAALPSALIRLPNLNARHVGILLEAFTRVGHPGVTALLDAVTVGPLLFDESAFERHPAALAQSLWAFAASGASGRGGDVVERLGTATIAALPALRPSDLSRVLWAYAVSDASGVAGLLTAAEPHVRRARHAMRAGDLCRTVWAYGSCGGEWSGVARELGEEVAGAVGGLSAGEVAEAAWAFARLRHDCPLLFRGLEAQSRALMSTFAPPQLAALLWAFAEVRCDARRLFSDALASVSADADSGEVALVVWACVAGGVGVRGERGAACLARLAHTAAVGASEPALALLMEAQLVLREEDAGAPALLPPRLNGAAWHAWADLVERETADCGGVRCGAVEAAVRGMGYECCVGWVSAGGLRRRCLVVERPGGGSVHVEVEEEGSYLREGRRVSGSALMRRRATEACGWGALRVPFGDWGALRGDEEEERRYVTRLLQTGVHGGVTGASDAVRGDREGKGYAGDCGGGGGEACQGGR